MGLKGRTVVSRIGGSPLRRSPAAAVLRRMMRADHSARPEDGTTVGKTLHRIVEKTLPDEIERAGFAFVADPDFLRDAEDTRTNIVFKNPTPNGEFVLKFRRP